MASGCDRLRLDTGELAIRKTQSRWWKQRYNFRRYHWGEKLKKCNEALKEAYEELKEMMYGEENIISVAVST